MAFFYFFVKGNFEDFFKEIYEEIYHESNRRFVHEPTRKEERNLINISMNQDEVTDAWTYTVV